MFLMNVEESGGYSTLMAIDFSIEMFANGELSMFARIIVHDPRNQRLKYCRSVSLDHQLKSSCVVLQALVDH